MKWLDNWFKNRLYKELDAWLEERDWKIDNERDKICILNHKVKLLKDTISEIEHITLKVPVEEYLLNSERFQGAIKSAKKRALQHWAIPKSFLLEPSLSSLRGTVTKKTPFECIINERMMIVMAGLKVRYNRKDQALYRMTIADRHWRPFVVGLETQQIIFPLPHLLDEDTRFSIRKLEGLGTLTFNVIGEVITTKGRFGAPEIKGP